MIRFGIESEHLPSMEPSCPHLTVSVWHGFVKIRVRVRGNGRPIFFNTSFFRVDLDQSAICSAEPGVSEGIKATAFRSREVSTSVQIQPFSRLNLQHLGGITPIRRNDDSPILPHVGYEVVESYDRMYWGQ